MHFHLHEPLSFSRAKQAGRENAADFVITGWLHQSGETRVYPRAAPSRPRADLASPRAWGASRNFRPVDTRDRSPLLLTLLLLLSASPSHGTGEDPRERDRQRHSYTFRSVKVDDPRTSVSFPHSFTRDPTPGRGTVNKPAEHTERHLGTFSRTTRGGTN